MNQSQTQQLASLLERSAANLRQAGVSGALPAGLERLAGQVEQPCVLAVVGRMKAGKSTFLNALLGQDVARTGVTETTATINRFLYGSPPDPSRPVRCCWSGGRYEDVGQDFLDALQGHDPATLRRAAEIERLEYLLPSPYLREVTLVDTPGTAAVVDDHQQRTAEFLNLQRQLRERHDQQTQRLGSEADAVIYLVGPVARSTDQAFLEEFNQATGGRSRAINAVGVLAKIDLQPELLARRAELAGKIAAQLHTGLNSVVPVSAGLRRAVDRLVQDDRKGLARLTMALRSIAPPRLKKLLDSEEFFLELEAADCPVTPAERHELLGDMPWAVFTTIARLAADPALDSDAVLARLDELAGFGPLKEVMERHFFKRARFLRCYRILNDARKVLGEVRFQQLPEFRKRDRDDRARQDRWLAFIRAAGGDQAVAQELEEVVAQHCGRGGRAERLEALLKELDRDLGRLFHDLEEHNADFEALELLHKYPELFSQAELDELRPLLGLYGVETAQRLPAGKATVSHVAARQQYWLDACRRARHPARRRVAERVEARYGLILGELMQAGGGA
jgi:hypothetical protein